ncbi:hypothetical protein AMK27_12300 [Streptomyces sp. CB02009]|uniref:hypothetical protein n=1 Tax=Streptomyces sp. CB02009 TaxID=1703938 RepID=UPI000938A8BC|nr:hypothetical protein [Streptomyces sp. CB02009]OKJ63622.1 hypothetical protein AMK27_12300 [Streptomyces sp. CB02009]
MDSARPATSLTHPDDPAFRAWLRALSHAFDHDFEEDLGSPGGRAFLLAAFTDNGAVPAPHFAPLVDEYRRVHAERVVAALLARARRDTGRAFDVPVRHEWSDAPDGIGSVFVGHEPVEGLDPVGMAVAAAEGVQCHLADRELLVWPLCPDHRTGPHATRTPDGAAWVCSVTHHVVAPVPS